MKTIRPVAAAQTVPVRGDVDANIAHHVSAIRRAAEERVRLLVFPELSLTGYELDLAADLAFGEKDARLVPLASLAASNTMTLVVGAPVRLRSRLHIGAFIITPEGSIDIYTKHHLGSGEEGVVAGDRNPLVRCEGNVAAVAVCADANRPSHPEAAAQRGAKTYLVSTFITPAEYQNKAAMFRAYAVRHAMTVVFANYGGPTGGLASAGRSAIWSDRGDTLAELAGTGSGLAIAYAT